MTEIDGLDAFGLLDGEAARLERWLAARPDDDPTWERASRCAGWTVRDVLAHLVASMDYNEACLQDEIPALVERATAAGAVGLDGFNDWGVRQRSGRRPADLLAEWRKRDAAFRAELRARGEDGTLATMVGPYPTRLQALHIASEYATHADDIGVPAAAEERAARLQWRAGFSRFAVVEAGRPAVIERRPNGNVVQVPGQEDRVLSDEELVEAVAGRPGGLPAEVAAGLRALA